MASIRVSLALSFAEKHSVLLINIASTVVLARLLTPTETGLYSVGAGIVNIAQTFRDFGAANYVLQEPDLTRQRLASALGISAGLGLVMTILFAGSSGLLAGFFGEPRLQTVILIMSFSFVAAAFASIGFERLRRAMNFNARMRIGIGAAVVHAGTSIVLAALGYGAIGMAWASLMGIVAGLIGTFFYFPQEIFLRPSLKEWRRVMDFGAFAGSGYLLQEIRLRTPDIVVGRMLGFAQAGLYSRGNGLVTLFQQALMNAITPVAMSALAMFARDRQEMRGPFLRYLGNTTVVAWPVLGMMALLALPVIVLFFGHQWLPSVQAARILCAAAAFWVVEELGMALFSAMGTARNIFLVQAIAVPLQLILLVAGASFSIELAASGMMVSTALLAVLTLVYCGRAIGADWRAVGGELAHSIAITAITLAVPLGLLFVRPASVDDLWWPSIAAGLGGIAAWLAALAILRHPFRRELYLLAARLWSMTTRGAGGKAALPHE